MQPIRSRLTWAVLAVLAGVLGALLVELVPASGASGGYTIAPVPPPKTALAGAPTVHAEKLSVRVACHGSSEQTCTGYALASTIEHFASNGSLSAVTAAKKLKRPRSKVVILARKTFTVPAGKTATITLTLGKAGKGLLKRYKKLPALLAVAETDVNTTVVASMKVAFTRPVPKGNDG